MLKLFISPGACAMASHAALEEAGAEYETQVVNLRAGEQKTPEFLAINPAGSTPALLTDEGPLTQNTAILTYVAQRFPDTGLAPVGDPYRFSRFVAFNAFLASSVHPSIGKVLFAGLEGEAREQALGIALSKYELLEDRLVEGPFVFGDAYTLADGYLAVFERWARQARLLDPARFPKLNAHLDAVQQRPAYRRMLEQEGLQPA